MKKGLNANTLKLIALVSMTVDHMGLILFPGVQLFRIIGRLAFPIFAYMIAEGCSHTKSIARYHGTLALVGLGCQVVYSIAMQSLYLQILVTFTISVGLIRLVKRLQQKKSLWRWLLLIGGVLGALFVSEILPLLLPGTDLAVDYGFCGIMLPVAVYLGKNRKEKLLYAAIFLALLCLDQWIIQWYSMLSLVLLALYDGTRGRAGFKWFFYIYYPAHIAVIFGIFLLFAPYL